MAWRSPEERDIGKLIEVRMGLKWRRAVLKEILRGPQDFAEVLLKDEDEPILRIIPLSLTRLKE